ncbi:putative Lysophospholipid acyltransferase LPEAT1 [Blattamonas nauphoetae]|uniref:Lysophospholipid acyltransferase LPEAT1 n=1 Tax=Blattamonas nauphoetae TaxID=2049346 RepID=A0ABQ9YC74_9EUKA|nr:putative Lysophospholipid acyltransferase LPEAT1 [Blattamonas nauphoetae]
MGRDWLILPKALLNLRSTRLLSSNRPVGDMTNPTQTTPLLDSNSKILTYDDITLQQGQVNAYEIPKFSCFGYFKFILGLILLFPIRAIFALTLSFILFVMLIVHLPFLNYKDKPHHPLMRLIVCFWGKFWARGMLLINGFWFIRERGHRDRKARLIVSNHQSCLDMFVFLYKCMPSFVIGEIIARNGFLGPLSKTINCVAVDRDAGGNSSSVLGKLKQRLTVPETGRQFPVVCMFPEGATGNGRTLNYFHTGAFVPGEPMQPILLIYHEKYNPSQWSVRSWPFHYITSMVQLTQWLEIRYLPTYYPSEAEKQHPRLYAYNIKQAMGKAGQFGQTELGYKDRKDLESKRKILKKRHIPLPQPEAQDVLFKQVPEPLTPVFDDSIDLTKREYHSQQQLPPPEILAIIEARPIESTKDAEEARTTIGMDHTAQEPSPSTEFQSSQGVVSTDYAAEENSTIQ